MSDTGPMISNAADHRFLFGTFTMVDGEPVFQGAVIFGENLTYDAATGAPNGGTIDRIEVQTRSHTEILAKGAALTEINTSVVALNASFADASLPWYDPSGLWGTDIFDLIAAGTWKGSASGEVITGGAFGDDIQMGDGDDTAYGGRGTDTLDGGDGNDTLYGGDNRDVLKGGDGLDHLYGGAEKDVLSGGFGNDVLFGGAANDTLEGNDGNDVLYGGDGQDQMFGGAGDDVLLGEAERDSLSGGAGSDTLFGGADKDRLNGQDGDDALFGGDSRDILNGGEGNDALYGGTDNDVLSGHSGNDRIFGDAGDDWIYGNGDDDEIYGGDGRDNLRGGDGHDTVYGGLGHDRLSGNSGDDILDGGAGNDRIHGGDGNDTVIGGIGLDQVSGGKGADTFALHTDGTAAGTMIIRDFDLTQDSITLETGDVLTSQEIHDIFMAGATQNGNQITYDDGAGHVMSIMRVDLGDLTVDHFAGEDPEPEPEPEPDVSNSFYEISPEEPIPMNVIALPEPILDPWANNNPDAELFDDLGLL